MNVSAHLDTIRQKLSHTRISEKIQSLNPTADITHRQWILHLSQQAAEVWEQDFLSDLDSQAKLIHCGRDSYELSASKALHQKKISRHRADSLDLPFGTPLAGQPQLSKLC